jgi:hypothetical protein
MSSTANDRDGGRYSASTDCPSRAALIEAWLKAYGRSPPKGISTRLLELAAAYNAQARRFGGHKAATRQALHAIAAGNTKPSTPSVRNAKGTPSIPGTRLIREWHGKTHLVDVLESGVLYQGRTYRSLSEVARVITGARWSGPRFFGL